MDFNAGTAFGAGTEPTLEGLLLQGGWKLNQLEDTYNEENPTAPVDRVTVVTNPTVTIITAVLPIKDLREDGKITLAAKNYLGDVGELPAGSDAGDFTSAHYPGLFFEIAQLMQQEERKIRPNVVQVTPNTVTIASDLEARTATVTCNLPTTQEYDGGIVSKAFVFLPTPV